MIFGNMLGEGGDMDCWAHLGGFSLGVLFTLAFYYPVQEHSLLKDLHAPALLSIFVVFAIELIYILVRDVRQCKSFVC